MRIGLVPPDPGSPHVSGVARVVYDLARGLADAGHDVALLRPEDVRAHAGELDVLHSYDPAVLSLGRMPVPLAHTIHHGPDARLAARYRLRPDVHYLVPSARRAQLERALAPLVVHLGLAPGRQPLGTGERDDALFLAPLAPEEGPELAATAARLAGVRLTVASAPPGADAPEGWRGEVEAALAAPGVLRRGPVSGSARAALLGGARALLAPLRHEEPSGLLLMEAMLSGTPVIAYARGAAPEVVDEGLTGFLVDGPEEMAAVLSSLDGFDRLACRRRAQARFGLRRLVREHELVYARVAVTVHDAWRSSPGADALGAH
jgi:glycosyltransferase involved in cell wall biosynthesis